MSERYKQTKEDKKVLEVIKSVLSLYISVLRKSGLRGVNIEIELFEHIKKETKKGEH